MSAYASLTANASLFDFKVESGKYADDAAFAVYAFQEETMSANEPIPSGEPECA